MVSVDTSTLRASVRDAASAPLRIADEHTLSQQADALSNQWHRQWAQAGAANGCLLLDTVQQPWGDDEQSADWIARGFTALPWTVFHPQLHAAAVPLYMAFAPERTRDSFLLGETFAAALRELQPAVLAEGLGRRLCAWLGGTASAAEMANHLARQSLQWAPDGTQRWLRLYDPAVMWLLWPLLSAAQQRLLLGPIEHWWLLSPIGQWVKLDWQAPSTEPAQADPDAEFELDAAQWQLIEHATALNAALRDWLASDERAWREPAVLDAARVAMTQTLPRALGHGLRDAQDLALFMRAAIVCHANFDTHALLAERLRRVEAGEFFSAAVDDIGDAQWQQIASDLSNGRDTTSTPKRDLSQ